MTFVTPGTTRTRTPLKASRNESGALVNAKAGGDGGGSDDGGDDLLMLFLVMYYCCVLLALLAGLVARSVTKK